MWEYLWGLSIMCANTILLVFVISSSCLLLLQTSPSDVGPLQLLNQEYLAIICNKCQQGWTEASRKCSGQKTHWHSFMQICTTVELIIKREGRAYNAFILLVWPILLLPEYRSYNEQKAICWQIVPWEVQAVRLTFQSRHVRGSSGLPSFPPHHPSPLRPLCGVLVFSVKDIDLART